MARKAGNPALGDKTFEQFQRDGKFRDLVEGRQMTVAGTANRTGILLLLATLSAVFTWNLFLQAGQQQAAMGWAYGGIFGGLIIGIVMMFRPSASPILAPVYALLEGLALGAISSAFNYIMPGVVPQAVGLTLATMGVMLMAYRSGLIRATEKFKLGVVAATGGIALFYLVLMIARAFGAGWSNLMWNATPLGIVISLVVVVVAALNLVLDFDLIEDGARQGAPKWMEWYCAYGLMVTLVWLYLELLRLLYLLSGQSNDD